jgi:heavy metal sensor kinase
VKRKYSLKTQLSLNIALVALLTVALISVVANIFIRRQFEDYITKRHQQRAESILAELDRQYSSATRTWDGEFLHAIGMQALYEGYIVKIYNLRQEVLWDTEAHDMSACAQMMEDISQKMEDRLPDGAGKFTVKDYDLTRDGQVVATVGISYFAPYFYSDDDFRFLNALNAILAGSGIFSLLLAVTIGWLLARRLSDPIRKTAGIAKQMSRGDYDARMEEKTSTSELDELMRSVNQLALSLNTQEKLRKQLTADVAHELRTPLTNVATHIEAMLEGVWEPTRERLTSCHEEILRIGRLVRDMENLARVESDNLKLDKTRVDLLELAKKTLGHFEADIAARKLKVSVEGSCPDVWGDRNRLQQVLTNLLSNAVKYTPPEGVLRVVLSDTDGSVFLVVEDNGVGISEDELPFVFERFYRADKSRSRSSGGSGIGLAVVKSIVTAHGGKVDVESRLNRGSRFRIALPKSPA